MRQADPGLYLTGVDKETIIMYPKGWEGGSPVSRLAGFDLTRKRLYGNLEGGRAGYGWVAWCSSRG